MECSELEWHGLWHPRAPGDWRRELPMRLVIYLVTPLALALLFGQVDDVDQFAHAYLGSFIVGSSIGVSFELLYRLVWPRVLHHKLDWVARIAAHAATIVTANALGVVFASWFGGMVFGWDSHLSRMWLQGVVISSVVISILITTDEMFARTREFERREAMHRVAVLRAELSALQARTDPHFLFNSLNAVAALIPANPALAETLLERLAAVFRYALDAGRRDTVALADEIDAVTSYLEVETLRLGSRLHWSLDRDAGLDRVRVPPLVLQPLVENAIRHGAGGRIGGTQVSVSARRRGGDVVLAVEDRGDDGDAAAPVGGGTGTALADLRTRLALVYAGRARVEAGASPHAGWRAEVVVPAETP